MFFETITLAKNTENRRNFVYFRHPVAKIHAEH